MVLEKATDVTKEFTVEEVGPISYVVDGRWMSFEPIYDGTPPFSYELIITKTSGPTAQNFNFEKNFFFPAPVFTKQVPNSDRCNYYFLSNAGSDNKNWRKRERDFYSCRFTLQLRVR